MNTLHQLDESRDTGLLAYISASRLNLWSRCPMAFKFRYLDEVRMPTNTNLFLGKAVHSALAMYYRNRQVSPNAPTVADAEAFTSQAWTTTSDEDAMDWDSTSDEEKSRGQAVNLVKAYISEYASQPERIVAMEVSLEAPLLDPTTGSELGVPLFGVVDLVLQEDDVPVVVDFKTAASATSICEQAHATQLSVYSELLESNGYSNVETEIRQLVKTKTPKVCAYRFGERGDRQRRQFYNLCREYLDSIDSGVYNFRPAGLAACATIGASVRKRRPSTYPHGNLAVRVDHPTQHSTKKEDSAMKNRHDFNGQFGALIIGAAIVSALASSNIIVGLVVGAGLGVAGVCFGAIRF